MWPSFRSRTASRMCAEAKVLRNIRPLSAEGLVRGQFRGGFSMRFLSLLSPMTNVVKAFNEGQLHYYGDVIDLSHQ
jgi:hypothetical protein